QLLPAFNESIDSLRQAIDAQTQLLSQRLVRSNDDAANAAYDAKRWIVWAFVIAGLVIGLLVAFVSASIRSSLRHVRD
ncbi:hypothetical protein C1X77_27755, partial [Pseudomonas sp. GW531-E2]|uniref:hypothetical protein n=1 Tax=Pseudomonas sp. GW531-E2 TaxID=2070679 RepID=UPI000CCA8B05